jgi:hypothetical protein
MPYIGTSSDQYQHRDPALTTYRKNTAAPALHEAMKERSEDKSKAAAVERRQVEGRSSLDRTPDDNAKPVVTANVTAQAKDPVTPQKTVHELYAPPSRLKREHDDRHSMVTGGTVDVRA